LSTLSWQQALVWLQRLSIDQTINFDLVTFGTIIRSCADGQQLGEVDSHTWIDDG